MNFYLVNDEKSCEQNFIAAIFLFKKCFIQFFYNFVIDNFYIGEQSKLL